jgi:hypothetical protein
MKQKTPALTSPGNSDDKRQDKRDVHQRKLTAYFPKTESFAIPTAFKDGRCLR